MEISAGGETEKSSVSVVDVIVNSVKKNAKQYTMMFALVAIWAVFTFLTRDNDFIFIRTRNLSTLFVQCAGTAILAIGMVLVIVAGHIDLSVGSVLGFCGAVCAVFMVPQPWCTVDGQATACFGPWPIIPALLLTMAVGLVIGMWHGFWIAYRKVPAFIVTLASMLAFRGLIIGIAGGATVSLEDSPAFKGISQGFFPTIAWIAATPPTTPDGIEKIRQVIIKDVDKVPEDVRTALASPTASADEIGKILADPKYKDRVREYIADSQKGHLHDTSVALTLLVILAFVVASLRKRASRVKYGFSVLSMGLETARLGIFSAMIGGFGLIMAIYQGIPWCILLLLLLAAIFTFVAENTTLGRHLYAIGGNSDAANLSGINIRRKTFYLFMLNGVMVAIAGIVATSRLSAATTSAGQNNELDAIASAVIGGTSLMGGEGTISGAVIGALLMASLDNGMSLLDLGITPQLVAKGLILLLAVWADMAQKAKK